MLKTVDEENVDKPPFDNSQSRQPKSLAARPGKDVEESCAFPVPRDNVLGFLLCAVKNSPERLARTTGGCGGHREGEKTRKFGTEFLVSSGLLAPLQMQEW